MKMLTPEKGQELLDRKCREVVPVLQFMEAAWMSHLFIYEVPLLMKQDRFCQTCQDLWYMDGDDFSDHLWEADLGGQRLGLNKQVECKLMELLHRLKEKHQRTEP